MEEKIIEILDELNPFIMSHGGHIEFVELKDNIVYIKMLGACANCEMLDSTIKDGIESTIKNEIPEIMQVINIA